MNPIIAGRPIALFKMSLFDSILLMNLYVKKYNININNCKVFYNFCIFANFFKQFCYISVFFIVNCLKGVFVEVNLKLDK